MEATETQKEQYEKDKVEFSPMVEGNYKNIERIYKRNLKWIKELPITKELQVLEDELASIAIIEGEKTMADYQDRMDKIYAHCDKLVAHIKQSGYQFNDDGTISK